MADATTLRVLIADDEPRARQRVADLLRQEPGVEIIGELRDGPATAEAIRKLKPDVVFMDVEMPGKSGLDVVRDADTPRRPLAVFVTEDARYALEAFEVGAVDYLVEPIQPDRFEHAVARARRLVELRQVEQLRGQLLNVLQGEDRRAPANGNGAENGGAESGNGYVKRIPVEMRGKVRVVPVEEIDYILSSGPYADLYSGDRRYVIRETMQNLEQRLDPERFIRVHRSTIVRVDAIDTLHKAPGGDYQVELKSGRRLRVSRPRLEALEKKLGVGE